MKTSALLASWAVLGVCACATTGAPRAGAPSAAPERAPAARGTRATDFALRDTKGRTVRLGDFLGKKVVLIDFWATYCEPCLGEMPHLVRVFEDNEAKGFVILAVAMDGPETVAEVPSFAARNGLPFPVLLDEDSHVTALYNSKRSAPLSVLIDRQGSVVRVREGYNPGDEALIAGDVSRLVAGEPLDEAPGGK